jgi:hypothetical protein
MKNAFLKCLSLFLMLGFTGIATQAKSDKAAVRVKDAIWAEGNLYATTVTTNSFKVHPDQSLDTIYSFGMSGLEGQRSVSEAGPGSTDYNGGRWHVIMAIFTDQGKAIHDPDGDGIVNFELTTAEMVLHHVDLGHIVLMPTDIYFSCPLSGPSK